MRIETRITELKRAVAAGEYAPAPEEIAAEIIAKLSLITLARWRMEALNGGRAEPEARPPRRFQPRPEPGSRVSEPG